ncbi:MAG TPA: DUF4383 domain-containing protein [Allosphingosinicella sp.]|jgi:hypothetical protein|nr:DUF4383 domain-containing protein [Allosphingosinicella sp.]
MSTRSFALILGLVFVAIGVAGFIPFLAHPEAGAALAGNAAAGAGPPRLLGPGDDMLFGLFPVNPMLSGFHVLCGLWGLAASRGRGPALSYARIVAILYALLAIAGLLPATQTGFGLVPLYAKDVWLHGLVALAAAYFAWVTHEAPPPPQS